jgi:hypothetical protein
VNKTRKKKSNARQLIATVISGAGARVLVDLQVVLIAKPLTEVLRLLAVHIAQTDFTKLPISK